MSWNNKTPYQIDSDSDDDMLPSLHDIMNIKSNSDQKCAQKVAPSSSPKRKQSLSNVYSSRNPLAPHGNKVNCPPFSQENHSSSTATSYATHSQKYKENINSPSKKHDFRRVSDVTHKHRHDDCNTEEIAGKRRRREKLLGDKLFGKKEGSPSYWHGLQLFNECNEESEIESCSDWEGSQSKNYQSMENKTMYNDKRSNIQKETDRTCGSVRNKAESSTVFPGHLLNSCKFDLDLTSDDDETSTQLNFERKAWNFKPDTRNNTFNVSHDSNNNNQLQMYHGKKMTYQMTDDSKYFGIFSSDSEYVSEDDAINADFNAGNTSTEEDNGSTDKPVIVLPPPKTTKFNARTSKTMELVPLMPYSNFVPRQPREADSSDEEMEGGLVVKVGGAWRPTTDNNGNDHDSPPRTGRRFRRAPYQFTPCQVEELESDFMSSPFCPKGRKTQLGTKLRLIPDAVLTWFRNARSRVRRRLRRADRHRNAVIPVNSPTHLGQVLRPDDDGGPAGTGGNQWHIYSNTNVNRMLDFNWKNF